MTHRHAFAVVALLVVAALLLMPLPFAWSLGWRTALLDLGHVPLFATLVFSMRVGLRLAIVSCVLIAIAIAGLAEVVQSFVGRTASWSDFLNGSLGAIAAGLLLVAWHQRQYWKHVAVCLLLVFAIVLRPILQVAPILMDASDGFHDFNTLAAFSTEGEMLRWEASQAEIDREIGPDGLWLGRVTFLPGEGDYSTVTLTPVVNDLNGYRLVCVSFTSEGEPLSLVLSVRGGPVEKNHTNHFQVAKTFPPGTHTMEISLIAATKFAKPHGLDPSEVYFVQLFMVRPTIPRTIRIHRLWVEK